MNAQKGFTLIELMIVVAIIGILAAIAIPAYQNYIAKTQVTRALGEISALKTSAEQYILDGKDTTSASDLGYNTSNIMANPPAVVVNTGNNGKATLTATLGGNASASVSKATITLTRADTGGWTCKVATGGNGGWKDSFIPAGCTK